MSQVIEGERPSLVAPSLRRYAAVVLLFALLGGVLAGTYAASRPDVYTSSSLILLRPSTGNPYTLQTGASSQQVTVAMTTEAALVDSDPVLKLINSTQGLHLTPDDVTVSVPSNTSTIVATVRAPSPTAARQEAQAVAEGYLSYRKEVTLADRKASVDRLTQQISTVKSSLAEASDRAQRRGDSQSASQTRVLTEQLISLQDLLNSAMSIDSDPGTLVSPAGGATRTGVSGALLITGGGLGGLMIGAALALWLGHRDRRVHSQAGSTVSGIPLLAVLGSRRGGDDYEGADRQAYQQVRTSVLASSALPSAVAVSGVSLKDTSSSVALELGRSMARAGYRVVLVMANAEEGGPFTGDSRGARGLAEALREELEVTDLLVEHDGVATLSAGSGMLQQQELLSGERFARVVHELKGPFDYVLVVTGPAILPAELATARLADAMLLVGRDGVTSRIDVGDVAARARLVGLHVSGLVLRSRTQ